MEAERINTLAKQHIYLKNRLLRLDAVFLIFQEI